MEILKLIVDSDRQEVQDSEAAPNKQPNYGSYFIKKDNSVIRGNRINLLKHLSAKILKPSTHPNKAEKKVNKEKAEEQLIETIKKILDRNWMLKREAVKQKIQAGNCSDDEAILLAKEFDTLRKEPPQLKRVESCEV